jgi:hypothetical protein
MGTMVAGWDKTGPNLYYVDNDGLRIKNEKFSVRYRSFNSTMLPFHPVMPVLCRLEAEAPTLSVSLILVITTTSPSPMLANLAGAQFTTPPSVMRTRPPPHLLPPPFFTTPNP